MPSPIEGEGDQGRVHFLGNIFCQLVDPDVRTIFQGKIVCGVEDPRSRQWFFYGKTMRDRDKFYVMGNPAMGPTFKTLNHGDVTSHTHFARALAIWGVGAKSSQALALFEASLAASGEAQGLQALLEGYRYATDTTVRKECFWRAVAWIRSHPRQIERALDTIRKRYVMGAKRFEDTDRLAERLRPILFEGRESQASVQIPNGIHAGSGTKVMDHSSPASLASSAGRYLIIQSLSTTETSQVFLVRDKKTGNQVVIKTLQEGVVSKRSIRDFIREINITKSLNHPGIPKILDIGDDFQLATTGLQSRFPRPFFVIEFVEGWPLDHWPRFGNTLPWQKAKEIFLQLCSILSALEAVGIEHRDVKSENVILTATETADLVVKLVDFGIAVRRKKDKRFRWSSVSRSDFPPGTPEIVAPERLRAHSQIDHRSDLYSLGILMYETLTSWLPFYGDSNGVTHHHLHTVPKLPSQKSDRMIPPCADAIIMKLLQKNPDDRFPSAEALAEAIRNCNE